MSFISRPVPRLLIAVGAAIFAVVAAIALSIQTSSPKPAWADTPVTINPDHIGATADEFDEQDCSGPLGSPPGPNYDGWHFVLPSSSGDNFTSITIQFTSVTAGPITAVFPDTDSGPGWVGYLAEAGNGDVIHAYIFTTPTGQAIVNGSATVSPDESTPGTFNLSHTCPGMSQSPSPSPSMSVSPSPSRSVSPSPSRSVSPSPSVSRSPRPTPSRTTPGYGYGPTTPPPVEPVQQPQHLSWWERLVN